jgi:hydroxymethylpyrimidine pyrophosphatase-like HAD family hydrolase
MKAIQNYEFDAVLRKFLMQSRFAAEGAVITDLDGTAVHEDQGRIYIPPSVEYGLKSLYELGRPVVLNSLRFPLSVMRTFGKEWLAIANAPIPVVSLYGSQTGFVKRDDNDELCFEELDAFPLFPSEIDDALKIVQKFLDGDVRDILLFYYPRDWRMGEIIWTPVAEKVIHVKNKYTSASSVTAVELEKLREQLLAEEICMIFLLVEAPQDKLMAYQHTNRSNFFTRAGVNKLTGTEALARRLGFDLAHSIGAGDSEMDKFLSGVGLAVQVGDNPRFAFRGLFDTVKLNTSFEFGDFLFRLAAFQRELSANVT